MPRWYPDQGKAKRGRIKVYQALAALENPQVGMTVAELVQKCRIGAMILHHNLYGLQRKGIITYQWQRTKRGARYAVVPGWKWHVAERILRIPQTYIDPSSDFIPTKAQSGYMKELMKRMIELSDRDWPADVLKDPVKLRQYHREHSIPEFNAEFDEIKARARKR